MNVCRSVESEEGGKPKWAATTMLPRSLAMFSPAGFLMVWSASACVSCRAKQKRKQKKKTAGFENNEHIMGHEISYVGEMEQENR